MAKDRTRATTAVALSVVLSAGLCLTGAPGAWAISVTAEQTAALPGRSASQALTGPVAPGTQDTFPELDLLQTPDLLLRGPLQAPTRMLIEMLPETRAKEPVSNCADTPLRELQGRCGAGPDHSALPEDPTN